MSAKRVPATTAKLSKAPNFWMDHINAITINDDNWRCMIIMMVETLPDHVKYVNLFDEAAEKGSRQAIYSIPLKKLMHNIKTLSRVDQDKCPPAQTVFHHANKLISRGESLEPQLIADLLKYLVYLAKNEAIARSKKETDLENDVDRELRAMLTTAKVESQPSMKSLKSKKSERTTEAPTTEKTSTNLRKRGEEWKDKVYIDDAPENGPDIFILLTGFRDPKLPLELIKAGLPLTCILKIKRPGECVNYVESNESHEVNDNNAIDHTQKVFRDSDIERKLLFDFWSKLDESANDPENLEHFSGVIFQTFCPPEIRINDAEEEEMMKKDLYDRVSCIVYDLHDLQRLHIDYIRNMKLQSVPTEPRRTFDVYNKIMDSVPTECAFVTVILQAMLTQVEIDIEGNRTSNLDDDFVRSSKNDRRSDASMTSKFDARSPYRKLDGSPLRENQIPDLVTKHRQKIHDLNIHYGIESNEDQQVKQIMNPEVILAGDDLRQKTHHVRLADDIVKLINPRLTSLSDLAVRSLRDTRILNLWRNYKNIPDVTKKKNRCHINKIIRCFDDQMDFERIVHYLHLQVFDKMINGTLNRTATRGEDRRVAIMEKGAIPASTRSDPFLLPSKILQNVRTSASGENPISNLRCFESDSIIDYDKSVGDTFECPELFYLTDTREMLQPGFLESRKEKLFARRVDSSTEVSDFTDVRLLPSDVFLQAINECLEKFDGFESSYLETTDSVLLYFDNAHSTTTSNTRTEDKVFQHGNSCRQISRIVTPICLRNFCEYVIREENDWIREMEIERAAKRSISAGELTRKLSHHSDIDVVKITTFTDDDFILPNSLKGQARKKDEDKSMQGAELALKKSLKLADKIEKNERSATTKSPKEMKKKDIKTVEVAASSVPIRRVPSLRCARDDEPYKFLGYDLGNLRIQIVSESETFVSSNGTVIKVELDQWLYGQKHLGIGISFEGCFLKLESFVGIHNNNKKSWHFITKNGIVLAFEGAPKSEEENQSFNNSFDFCASWPSGLVVKPVGGNSSVYPSCILQKYISKGPECEPVSRENYRKFLSNGTVLKFLDDETVEVLRPNGTIVRCINFEKTTRARDLELERYQNLTKEEISKSKKMRSSMKGLRKASSPKKRSSISASSDLIHGEIQSSRDQAERVKITRYTTLEHDGRHYETVNDEVTRVFDKSLVRTSTDFEVCEKFTRREDGTQSVLNSKGELIVSFPDGTCITTGFIVEDEPLICDWSDDEFKRFFRNSHQSNDKVILSDFSDVSWTSSNRASIRQNSNQEDKNIILLPDAFVSVLMTCRMEHECYTTVSYDPVKESYELSMPDEVIVNIMREGWFDVKIGANIELQIRENNLKYSTRDCVNNKNISETIYNFPRSEIWSVDQNLSSILLMTTDAQGNIFTVYANGNVNRNNDTVRSPPKSLHKQCRLFAMSRDLTAYEYLHKSERNEFQKRMNSDARSSVISIPNRKAGGLEYRLFLNPPDPTNYSKMWLQRVTKIKQANHNGIDLSPSTYSNPYEWIFPFGRNGNGRKNTWKNPFGDIVEDEHPRMLILTIFQRIAEEGKNLLIELQKALACYWRSTIKVNGTLRTCSLLLEDSLTSSDEKIDKWLIDLALGIEKNIDMEKYLSGVSITRTKLGSNKFSEASKRAKFGKQNALIKAELQMYEECFREKIILPYFENIRGVCFHWIMSWVDRAFEHVEKY